MRFSVYMDDREGSTGADVSVVHLALGGLGKLVVLFHCHVLFELREHHTQCVTVFPSEQAGQCLDVHLQRTANVDKLGNLLGLTVIRGHTWL